MKITQHLIICTALLTPAIIAAPPAKEVKISPAEIIKKHGTGAKKLANEQDELSADVQDLIDEQTDAKVIELLREVETIMADATDQLDSKDTGGATIATQTEVIEKIFEAAKKKQEQQQEEGEGQGQGQEGMMEMLQRMMEGGQDQGEGQQPGEGEGEQPGQAGDKPGQGTGSGGEAGGKTGDPDNTEEGGQRRVPRNSGNSGTSLPREFQKAMDAYNKGAAKKASQR